MHSNVQTTRTSLERIASAATDPTPTDVPPARSAFCAPVDQPPDTELSRQSSEAERAKIKGKPTREVVSDFFFSFSGANFRLPGLEDIINISEWEMQ